MFQVMFMVVAFASYILKEHLEEFCRVHTSKFPVLCPAALMVLAPPVCVHVEMDRVNHVPIQDPFGIATLSPVPPQKIPIEVKRPTNYFQYSEYCFVDFVGPCALWPFCTCPSRQPCDPLQGESAPEGEKR